MTEVRFKSLNVATVGISDPDYTSLKRTCKFWRRKDEEETQDTKTRGTDMRTLVHVTRDVTLKSRNDT